MILVSVADWVTASAAVATVLIYIALAWYASRQVGEARSLREEQTRPFVIAEFDPDFLITFRIRNVGATIARNVTVEWNEWPTVTGSFADDPAWKSKEGSVLFSSGIPSLAPDQEISTLFDHFPKRVSSDLPMTYTVRIRYSNYAAGKKSERHYEEEFVLDLNLFMGLRHLDRKDLHDLVGEVQKLRQTTEKWTDAGRGGLNVMTTDRVSYMARENRPMKWDDAKVAWRRGNVRGLASYVLDEVRRKYGLHSWGDW